MTVNPTPIEDLGGYCAATGLHRFRSRKTAEAALTQVKINAALNGNSNSDPYRSDTVWQCNECGGWHNRKPKRRSRPSH